MMMIRSPPHGGDGARYRRYGGGSDCLSFIARSRHPSGRKNPTSGGILSDTVRLQGGRGDMRDTRGFQPMPTADFQIGPDPSLGGIGTRHSPRHVCAPPGPQQKKMTREVIKAHAKVGEEEEARRGLAVEGPCPPPLSPSGQRSPRQSPI